MKTVHTSLLVNLLVFGVLGLCLAARAAAGMMDDTRTSATSIKETTKGGLRGGPVLLSDDGDVPSSVSASYVSFRSFSTKSNNRRTKSEVDWVPAWNEFNANQHVVTFDFGDTYYNVSDFYAEVVWHMTLDCASGGCGSWDTVVFMELEQADGSFIHVGRCITPFGVPTDYSFSMTDWQPLFVGRRNVQLRVSIYSYQGAPLGWVVTWTTSHTLGEPNPYPVAVIPLWNSPPLLNASHAEFGGGDGKPGTLPAVPPVTITLPTNTTNATIYKILTLVTGHGQGNKANAAEFLPDTHAITWSDAGGGAATTSNNNVHKTIWRDDCATSTVHPQYGSYEYSRAGWCPGGIVRPWLSGNVADRLLPPVVEEAAGGAAVVFHYLVDFHESPYINTCRPGFCEPSTCADPYVDSNCSYDSSFHTMPTYCVSSVLIAYR